MIAQVLLALLSYSSNTQAKAAANRKVTSREDEGKQAPPVWHTAADHYHGHREVADKALPKLGGLYLSPKLQVDTIHHLVNHPCLHHLACVDVAVGQGFYIECARCYRGLSTG